MATTALVTGVLTTTAATVFNGGFASNANSTVGGTLAVTGNLSAANATFSSASPLITGVDTDVDTRIFTIGGNNGNCIIDVDPNGTAGGSLFQVDVDNGEVLKLTSAGAYVTGLLDVSTNAVIDGTALVTGVLTTTATTVFNGGYDSNGPSAINPDTAGKDTFFFTSNAANDASMFLKSDTTNKVNIQANGVSFFNGGNVGINEASPDNTLHVNSGSTNIVAKFESTDSIAGILLLDNGGNVELTASGSTFQVQPAGGVSTFSVNSSSVFTPTAGTSNVRLGVNAGDAIVSGTNYNVLIGDEAGTALNSGDQNVAVGYQALASENAASNHVAVGYRALMDMDGGNANCAVGASALENLTNASRATAVGNAAGYHSLGADDVTFIGNEAGHYATTATYSTFVGSQAGKGITGTKLTGNFNTAIGYNAGLLLQGTATENTLVGALCGDSITTGDENVCMGMGAGSTINTGTRNTCLGDDAGSGITTATRSIAIGHIAMGSAVASKTGTGNVAIGYQTGNALAAGAENVMIGEYAGDAITSGSRNTCVGMNSGSANTTAVDNVFLGNQAGTYTVGTTTGSYNTIVGGYCHTSAVDSIQQIVMGHNVTGNGNNTLCFGNAGTDSSIAFGATSITAPSDQRYKEEIADATAGLSFIKDLRPVTFKWKKEKDVPSDHPAYVEGSDKRVMESNGETNHGFIAQEVKAVIDNHSEIKDGFAMWSEQGLDENGDSTGGRQRLGDGALIPILVKAIQELEARLAVLEG
jgi:hypothetical protein